MDTLQAKLTLLTSPHFDPPKGILFFGPPGTGKSAISKTFCKELPIELVAPPMAAGDCNKGIVGDSERMLNEMADRAALVPWQTCAILIDEIESLVPDRQHAGGKGSDLLGVLLAILEGTKTQKNLLMVACTNLRESIDPAFLRRMQVQVFLGGP